MLIFRSPLFLVLFLSNSKYRILVGYAYVLSFRPVALQIKTTPGGVGWGGVGWVGVVNMLI